MADPAFKRILLKLSGEALMGELQYGTDPERVIAVARQVSDVRDRGVEVAIVVGAGNIYRGMQGAAAVSNVRMFQGGQIAMILTVTSNFGGKATQIVMNNVLIKDGDKFRFLEIKSDSGQTVVSGGIVKANGQQTKWLQKCGG